MDMISKEQLEQLVEHTRHPCISIYMPTERVGEQVRQNVIRFRNALREVEGRLSERGMRSTEVDPLLQSARSLTEQDLYWLHQADGLAVFISPERLELYRLPIRFDEIVMTMERFYIKPLLPMFTGNGPFYLLSLSKDQIRLFQGSRYRISELELSGLPTELSDVLQYEEYQKQLQFYTGAPPRTTQSGGTQRDSLHFGTGDRDYDEKERLLHYLRKIDQGLQELLANGDTPLVLAGVEYLTALYRDANNYPHVLPDNVTGSPDRMNTEELHAKAWDIVAPYHRHAQLKAAEKFESLVESNDMASGKLEEVIPATQVGRVESLFVPIGQQTWGNVDQETGEIEIKQRPDNGNRELLDYAAVKTIQTSGTVYAVPPEEIPGDGPIAAVYRYPLST